jgi:hypothetical protein
MKIDNGPMHLLTRIVLAISLASLLVVVASSVEPRHAEADGAAKVIAHHWDPESGQELIYFEDDDGYFVLIKGSWGEPWVYVDLGKNGNPGNPNPEGTSGGPDINAMIDLAKQHGSPVVLTVDFSSTPLGLLLGEHGKTIDPYYNPAEMTNEFDGLGGGGFDPNGGSFAEQLKKASRGGDDDDDNHSDDPTNGDGLFGDLPGPPELVNPAPLAR